MPSDEKILDHYTWATGDCFRCARSDLSTTRVETIVPRSGEEHEVRACRECVLALESDRRRSVERRGEVYEPGHLGETGCR